MRWFQSLSGLTLCCDIFALLCILISPAEFQSLSGLTLCCDWDSNLWSDEFYSRFNPFQG